VRLKNVVCAVVVVLQGLILTSCLGPDYPSGPPLIVTQPGNQTVTTGQAATFSVKVAGGGPFSYAWQRNGAPIPGATSAAFTTTLSTPDDDNATFRVEVTNALAKATSNPALLRVHDPYEVLTWHNDNARTGQNLGETFLTPANVNSTTFGKVGFLPVEGKVDAQPLFVANVPVSGRGTRNVLYVATEHDSVYAFDADTGTVFWQVSLLGAGEVPSDDHGVDAVTPEIGITSTPVVDRTRGPNGALYAVAMSKNAAGGYFQRIHALDIATGAELFSGPTTIQAKYPGNGEYSYQGNVYFDPAQYKERSALLLSNGVVYTSWCSHEDHEPYTGWVIGYDASTLTQSRVLDTTPNGGQGAFWNGGSGPAADSEGNIYLLAANGTFDPGLDAGGFPSEGDYGNAFLKLSPAGGKLAVVDYFEMMNQLDENRGDFDLGSGGVLLLPDLTDSAKKVWHLAVGAGKDGNIYVADRDSMGKFNSLVNNIHQQVLGYASGGTGLVQEEFGGPAYFNNTLYFGGIGDYIKGFAITNSQLPDSPAQQTVGAPYAYPGATPSISANGSQDAILWAIQNRDPAILLAYDANNLANELYNSTQAPNSRDEFGPGNKFITPTIANGKVYVGTRTGVAVFGLLP
jgi:outer membrane protein assembly factor BamB